MAGIENFNPRSPCGERHIQPRTTSSPSVFQSTLPMRGATLMMSQDGPTLGISIHAPHAGSDNAHAKAHIDILKFQSTLPMRGATSVFRLLNIHFLFQSTLPMRGATVPSGLFWRPRQISIHAPHAGSDPLYTSVATGSWNFNPRSPCGERRSYPTALGKSATFQSTLPMRGATMKRSAKNVPGGFQSTLPMRGATLQRDLDYHRHAISIHAPHAGSDQLRPAATRACVDFNPRSPCGERHATGVFSYSEGQFQSTLPMRGATCRCRKSGRSVRYFNPRSPCGERHGACYQQYLFCKFQSTLPMRGATARHRYHGPPWRFQSTLPMRGATSCSR